MEQGKNKEWIKKKGKRVANEAADITRNDFLEIDRLKGGWWSKLSWFTGFSTLLKVSRSVLYLPFMLGGFTYRLLVATFSKEKIVPLPTDSQCPFERFNVARVVYNTDDNTLKQMVRATYYHANLYLVVFAAMFCYGLIFFNDISSSLSSLSTILSVIFPFYLLPFISILFLRSSFNNYQLRKEALYSFGHFLKSGEIFSMSKELEGKEREPMVFQK